MPSTGCLDGHITHWTLLHDRIKPVSSKINSKSNKLGPVKLISVNASMNEYAQTLESLPKTANYQTLSVGINKNSILLEYQESCITKGFANQYLTTTKDEASQNTSYPSHHCLIADCKMKPSLNLYY
jgi:hypothetical protein